MTVVYGFVDYRAQGQTLSMVLIDIATPPGGGGKPNLFSLYVALSRSTGCNNI
jgi:hypothetical protein